MDFLALFPTAHRNSVKAYSEDMKLGKREIFKDSIYQYTAILNDIEYADYFFLDLNVANWELFFEAYNNLTVDGVKNLQKDLFEERFYLIAQDKRWSQYFYIVCENEDIFQSITDIFKIQQEMNFVFKHIVKREEIHEIPIFLDFSIFKEHDNSSMLDIDDIWQSELGKIGLSKFIFKETIPDKAINDYLELDQICPDKKTGNLKTTKKDLIKVEKIDSIEFKNYRSCYDKTFKMDFCNNVNLFYGANGAGKTGILEGIEIAITGKNNRTPQDDTSKIFASVKSGKSAFTSNSSPSDRKNMDAAWYHSSRESKDKLNDNFCTFNFFHTYKTRNLQDSDDLGRDIISKLTNLIFSQDTLQCERNINNLRNNFIDAKKRIEKDKTNTLSELNRLTQYLRSIEQDSKDINLSELIKNANLYFKQKINSDGSFEDNLAGIDSILRPLIFSLNFFDESILGETAESLSNLVKNKEKLYTEAKIGREKLVGYLEAAVKIKGNKDFQEQFLREIGETKKYFAKEAYIDNYQATLSESVFEIRNLQNFLDSLVIALSSRDWLKKLRITELNDAFKSVETQEKQIEQLNSVNEKELSVLISELKKLEKFVKEADELNSQLKVFGMKKLEQDAVSKKCPMCEHEYKNRQELLSAIEKTLSSTSSAASIYQSLLGRKADLEKNKLDYKEKIVEFEQKKEALQIVLKLVNEQNISFFDFEQYSLFDLAEKIKAFLTQRKEQIRQLEIAKCFYETLHKFDYNFNKENILKYLDSEHEKLLRELGEINSSILDYEKKANELSYISEEFVGNKKTELERVKKYDDTLKSILAVTNFKTVDSITHIKNTITTLDKLYKNAQLILANEKNKSNIQKRIKEETDAQLKNDKKLNKIKTVMDTIKHLPKTKDAGANYIEANKNKIEKLFKLIHKPREFNDLKIEDKQIKINRKVVGGTEEITDSNHMSMGQQVSLALAVMLTLHFNAKDAPNVMMLDEPIANLDDLHFINMLDILRRIAILGKQIFITTASKDIAAAMRRKFSIFKKGYGHFELEREEDNYVRIFRNYVDPRYENIERVEIKKISGNT